MLEKCKMGQVNSSGKPTLLTTNCIDNIATFCKNYTDSIDNSMSTICNEFTNPNSCDFKGARINALFKPGDLAPKRFCSNDTKTVYKCSITASAGVDCKCATGVCNAELARDPVMLQRFNGLLREVGELTILIFCDLKNGIPAGTLIYEKMRPKKEGDKVMPTCEFISEKCNVSKEKNNIARQCMKDSGLFNNMENMSGPGSGFMSEPGKAPSGSGAMPSAKGNSCRPEMNSVCAETLGKFIPASQDLPKGNLVDDVLALCTSTAEEDKKKCFHAFHYVFFNYMRIRPFKEASSRIEALANGANTAAERRLLQSSVSNSSAYRALRTEDTSLSASFSADSVKSSIEAVAVVDGATPTSMPSSTQAETEQTSLINKIKNLFGSGSGFITPLLSLAAIVLIL